MASPATPDLETPADSDQAHPFLDKDQGKIQRLFDAIAPRYDLLNHLLSFQLDHLWRRQAVSMLTAKENGAYLDLCTGTGDLAFALNRRLRETPGTRIFSSDFSVPMLLAGQHKRVKRGPQPFFLAGDTLSLPFADNTFAGATVGFGIRNVEDLERGLSEVQRVLEPGGEFVILEFTPVDTPVIKQLFDLYCHGILPKIGNLISGTKDDAYSYLQQSIDRWPRGDDLASRMKDVGFKCVRWKRLLPGNVALHHGYA